MAKDKAKVTEEETVKKAGEPEPTEADLTEEFITRRLRVINRMSDRAKAKRLAERVLMNRKG